MKIEQISNKKELDEFIRFPWKVYQGDPHWVPPLLSEVRFILSEKNPFFKHAEAAYFIARRNGEVVGRVAAILDRNHINFQNEQAGFFGFFECLPDPIIAHDFWMRQRAGSENAISRSCEGP